VIACYYTQATGEVWSVLSGPDLGGFPLAPEGSLALLLDSPVNLPGYIQGTTFFPQPYAPSAHHTWDWATRQWVLPLPAAKAVQWALIKASRDAAENGTFVWNGHTLAADKERINGAATGAIVAQAAGATFSDVWTLADNTTIPVTAQDILSMGMALVQHVSACHARGRALRALIDNATTPEEVASITWDTPT
jgi:hypothetical protein